MLTLVKSIEQYFQRIGAEPKPGPDRDCFWNPGGDLVTAASDYIHGPEVAGRRGECIDYKVCSDNSVWCESYGNSREGHPIGDFCVEPDVWPEVLAALQREGFDLRERKE